MYKFKHQLCFEQELLPFFGGNSKAIRIVFWKIYAVIQEFYATVGRSGRAKYQLWSNGIFFPSCKIAQLSLQICAVCTYIDIHHVEIIIKYVHWHRNYYQINHYRNYHQIANQSSSLSSAFKRCNTILSDRWRRLTSVCQKSALTIYFFAFAFFCHFSAKN